MAGGPRIRSRGYRVVPVSSLRDSPHQWRTHPASQRDALRESVGRLGFLDPPLVREVEGGYELLDGHLRKDLLAEHGPDAGIPVVVTDLTDEEAPLALAVLDPLGAQAGADAERLSALLARINEGEPDLAADSPNVAALLEGLAKGHPVDDVEPPDGFAELDPDDLETGYRCPRCGYEWSGKPR